MREKIALKMRVGTKGETTKRNTKDISHKGTLKIMKESHQIRFCPAQILCPLWNISTEDGPEPEG